MQLSQCAVTTKKWMRGGGGGDTFYRPCFLLFYIFVKEMLGPYISNCVFFKYFFLHIFIEILEVITLSRANVQPLYDANIFLIRTLWTRSLEKDLYTLLLPIGAVKGANRLLSDKIAKLRRVFFEFTMSSHCAFPLCYPLCTRRSCDVATTPLGYYNEDWLFTFIPESVKSNYVHKQGYLFSLIETEKRYNLKLQVSFF